MKFTIYHAVNPTFGFGKKQSFPEAYKKVAIVESESLGDTFRITNHIEHDWTTNPEVVELFETTRHRSTSVGDVAVDENDTAHYCDMVGWKELVSE